MLDSAMSALVSLTDPSLLLMLLVGVLAGLVMELTHGLGGTASVAILLPITFGMDPAPALAMLIGALAVVRTSDTVSAVLLGAPGSASASVTMLDSYSMAKKGQTKRALSLAFLSSMAGGIIGAVGLTLAIPSARPMVLSFASPELFMLTVLGVAMAAVLSRGNVIKGLTAGALGLMVGMIGTSPTTAEERFTFGSLFLGDGLSLVAVALGVFGLAEIASRAKQRRGDTTQVKVEGGWGSGIREWLTHWSQVLRGGLIGIWAGSSARRRHSGHLAGLWTGGSHRKRQDPVRQGRPARHRWPGKRQQLGGSRRPDSNLLVRNPGWRSLGNAAGHAADLRHPARSKHHQRAL